jgi:hypothetical protein
MESEPLAQNHSELKQIGVVEPLSLYLFAIFSLALSLKWAVWTLGLI